MKKKQSKRLTDQHKLSKGVEGIFGKNARAHDVSVGKVSKVVMTLLEAQYNNLDFRYRKGITKTEINKALQKVNPQLGQTLFVKNASIKPDGGIIEVKDKNANWRVILISEAKRQGKDIDNIRHGKQVGKNSDQDLMAAGNAIERSHKNIAEISNYMLGESYFPYVLFLEGSNFLTETISVERPDGRIVKLQYNSGMLNRIDRLTASNFGLPINTNLCENLFIDYGGRSIMLQATSIYTQGDGEKWDADEMAAIMLEIAQTSMDVIKEDLS